MRSDDVVVPADASDKPVRAAAAVLVAAILVAAVLVSDARLAAEEALASSAQARRVPASRPAGPTCLTSPCSTSWSAAPARSR